MARGHWSTVSKLASKICTTALDSIHTICSNTSNSPQSREDRKHYQDTRNPDCVLPGDGVDDTPPSAMIDDDGGVLI